MKKESEKLLTIPQAAERLALSRRTVFRLLHDGVLASVDALNRTGGKRHATRIKATDLMIYVKNLPQIKRKK